MKKLTAEAIILLIVCLTLCAVSQWGLNRILDEAHEMTTEIYASTEAGRQIHAKETLVALATLWNENADFLEILCDHDDIHNVKERIIQARICIDYEDMEEFYSAVALIGEGIEHIRDKESLSLTNLY